MSITFTQTTVLKMTQPMFQEEFQIELKNAADGAGIPYKTASEKLAFEKIIWELVIDELGNDYSIKDDEPLDQTTAGFAIRHTVHEVIRKYTSKFAEESANKWEADKGLSEEDETHGWEEVYNGGKTIGFGMLETNHIWDNGTYYQTYGNGGGKGGQGGYWVMKDRNDVVYEVAGRSMTIMKDVCLEFRPENQMIGQVAAVRLLPFDRHQARLERQRE